MGRRSAVAVAAGILLLLVIGTGSARAAGCTDSWTGSGDGTSWFDMNNWSAGVPTITDDVCINNATDNTVVVTGNPTAHAKSLQLGVGPGSGNETLEIEGVDSGSSQLAELDLQNGGTIGPNGDLELTGHCSAGSCTHQPSSSLSNLGASALINNGTIESDPGNEAAGLAIYGNTVNHGTIQVNAALTWSGGNVDNQGTISLANNSDLNVGCCANTLVLTNDTGGLITNNGGSGAVVAGAGATISQGAGTTSPSSVNPPHPAVSFEDVAFDTPLPHLIYSGSGASAIAVHGGASLSGNIASSQSLNINATSCSAETQVTAASSFTNAGTLTLGGPCDASLVITSGSLTNTANLVLAATSGSHTRELMGGLINSGTLTVAGNTAFDGSGATLVQTGGSTTFPIGGATFDTSGSGSTFQLQGGTLSGGGHTTGTAAIITGPVNNTGGNLIPGTTTSPGIFSVSGYTQGSGGTLTTVIDGTSIGTGYGQLSSQGNATVGGTLAITTLSSPSSGQIYTVLGTPGGTRSGQFTKVTGRVKPEGAFPPGWTFGFKPDYSFPNAVALDADAAFGLRVKRAGPGTGSVTSSPSGINCGTTCDAPFFATLTVTLTAHPGSGWVFGGWSGACKGTSTSCRVKMNQARTVTATFSHASSTVLRSSRNPGKVGRKVTYTATVSPNPMGGKVRFTSNGKAISACRAVVVNAATGKATCSVKYRSPGTRRIKASYLGNGTYAPSRSSTLSERVKR